MNNLVQMNEAMELEVPAAPEFVGTARLFTAEASRHLGVGEETVADLKIAISEACTGAIEAQESDDENTPVRLSIRPEHGSLKVEVHAESGFDRRNGGPEPANGLGLGLVKALFPEAEFLRGASRNTTLRIHVPLGEEL